VLKMERDGEDDPVTTLQWGVDRFMDEDFLTLRTTGTEETSSADDVVLSVIFYDEEKRTVMICQRSAPFALTGTCSFPSVRIKRVEPRLRDDDVNRKHLEQYLCSSFGVRPPFEMTYFAQYVSRPENWVARQCLEKISSEEGSSTLAGDRETTHYYYLCSKWSGKFVSLRAQRFKWISVTPSSSATCSSSDAFAKAFLNEPNNYAEMDKKIIDLLQSTVGRNHRGDAYGDDTGANCRKISNRTKAKHGAFFAAKLTEKNRRRRRPVPDSTIPS